MDSMGPMPSGMPTNMSLTNGTDLPPKSGMMMSTCKIDMLWNWYTIDACFISHSWHITSRGMFAGSCIGAICLVLCLEALRRLGREYDAFILRRARLRQLYLSKKASKSSASYASAEENHAIETAAKTSQGNDARETVTAEPVEQQDQIIPAATAAAAAAGNLSEKPSSESTRHEKKSQSCSYPINNADTTLSYRPSPVEQVVRALLHTLQFGVAYIIMLLAMYYNGYIIICIFIGAFLGSLVFSWEPVSLNDE
ncbi:hypothetical protein N7532_004373 [Penicillium argentinense]|uniref:Copper transport protein n=1 Tax=Penicillium argentinense TaxID=1131581 RepID=A0A9W9KEV0_9EURO|nr:uncharacterized protein N7532_004373 [Penicillium argentinense]KAJ5103844.1 hypothetical protein N7532_004373 [Penicillium argentinense]